MHCGSVLIFVMSCNKLPYLMTGVVILIAALYRGVLLIHITNALIVVVITISGTAWMQMLFMISLIVFNFGAVECGIDERGY